MISFKARPCFLAIAVSLANTSTGRAYAQAQDEAIARALFDEGRRLADAGQYSAACPKFEAARRARASTGVLMNLADCYEKTGRTASAWTTFGEAASVAVRAGREGDHIEATRRQTALEPHLSRLVIHIDREVPSLIVKNDGVEIPKGAWDVPIPIDPGTHEMTAEAPNRQSWKKSFETARGAQTTSLEIPELSDTFPPNTGAHPESPQPSLTSVVSAQEDPSFGRTQRFVGLSVAGAGIIAVGIGGVIALVAKAHDSAAAVEPGIARHTDSVSAVNLGNAATVVVVVGAAATAAGAVVWLTAPTGRPQFGTKGQEILLRGTF
jgi:hypothetical protein